ncbi:MAG: PD-(D/E)XK nuclease family protein, partial [Pseudomonadota bacterium]
SLIDWQAQFEKELALLAWPAGGVLVPDEQDLLIAWRQLQDVLVSLSSFTGLCTRRHACYRLTTIAQQRTLNTALRNETIAIVNFDEAAVYGGDAVAWCGLGQFEWPLATAVNPLLPFAAQREAGLPGTRVGQDTALAMQAFRQCVAVTNANRFSFTALVDDVPNRPINGFDAVDQQTMNRAETKTASLSFTECEDLLGLPLATEVPLSNAVRFFADQAACPFCAYVAHRLGSDTVEEPAMGLDPRRRGELVHLAVAALWESLQSSAALKNHSAEGLQRLVKKVVDEVINAYQRESRQLPQYWPLEADRLQRLLNEWLAVETERGEFSVEATEKRLEAEIARLRFNVRIDRIDRLANDTVAVIDFKTGVDTRGSWAAPRIEQPQLPIYATNLRGDDVSAIAYAQIRSGECKLVDLPKSALSKLNESDEWANQLREWRHDLYNTAEQIAAGDAAIDPKHPATTCRQCDQQLLCRANEKAAASREITIVDGFLDSE